jgi:hypothetical protein
MIVHNHTAVDCSSLAPAEATPPVSAAPGTPAPPKPQN